jgi:hypothetical protein
LIIINFHIIDVKQRTKMGQNPDVPMEDEDNIEDNDGFSTDEE